MAKKKNSKFKHKGFDVSIEYDGNQHFVSIEKDCRVVNTFGDDGFDSGVYARKQAKDWIDDRVPTVPKPARKSKPARKVGDPFESLLKERKRYLFERYHRLNSQKPRGKLVEKQTWSSFGHLQEIEEIIMLYIESKNEGDE